MTSPQDNARTVLGEKLINDAVKVVASEGKVPAEIALLDWMKEHDVKSLEVTHPVTGEKVGTITRTGGGREAYVDDEARFLAYVAEEHPGEIETVRRVRPAFQSRCLEFATKAGELIDPVTGRLPVPGLGMRDSRQGLSRTTTPQAKVQMLDLVRGAGLRQLTRAPQPPETES